MATKALQLQSLRRSFVTPEGVDLQLELASAGSRAGAFLIDFLMMIAILIAVTLLFSYIAVPGAGEFILIVWLIGFFVLRNGWFSLFEMGNRGATPGKRLMGLRVTARDGARLTGAAVIARNAMREIEIFLPLSFLGAQTVQGTADTFLVLFALLWSGIFLFFPLFNRDRLRVGDLVAGTWVVQSGKLALSPDLVGSAHRPRRTFGDGALSLYGIYELQMLEEVLRNEQPEAIAIVARTIRAKAGIPDDGEDYGFLSDYYAALCARLERQLLVGLRRDSKHNA
ncbi:MAG TPA: RDD family protein [Sphingomicrobium sp.]|nr:RDD family protein [Sphingomicrobium sp.]